MDVFPLVTYASYFIMIHLKVQKLDLLCIQSCKGRDIESESHKCRINVCFYSNSSEDTALGYNSIILLMLSSQ